MLKSMHTCLKVTIDIATFSNLSCMGGEEGLDEGEPKYKQKMPTTKTKDSPPPPFFFSDGQ